MSRRVGCVRGNIARRPSGEQGSVSVLFTFIVVTAVTLATFLVDAGTQLQAATRADTYAAEAARAATQGIGPVPTGGPQDAVAAVAAAQSYLSEAAVNGTVTLSGPATVTVTVTVRATTPVLGVAVVQTRSHTATLLVGVDRGEPIR